MSHDTATPSYEDLVQRTGQNDFRRGRLLSIALVIVGAGAFAWLLTSGQSREAWTA